MSIDPILRIISKIFSFFEEEWLTQKFMMSGCFYPYGLVCLISHKFLRKTFFTFITSYIYSFDMPIINFVHAGTKRRHATKG